MNNTLPIPVEVGQEMFRHAARKLHAEKQCRALADSGWSWHTGTYRASHYVGDIEVIAEFDFGLDAFAVSIPDMPGISGHAQQTADLEKWILELKNFVVSGIAPNN